jgi:hypothetical protein
LFVESPLAGSYQAKNILTVIRSFEVIRDELKSQVNTSSGIRNVLVNTQQGRWQKNRRGTGSNLTLGTILGNTSVNSW